MVRKSFHSPAHILERHVCTERSGCSGQKGLGYSPPLGSTHQGWMRWFTIVAIGSQPQVEIGKGQDLDRSGPSAPSLTRGMDSRSHPTLTLHRNLDLRPGHPCTAAALADIEPLVTQPYVGDQEGLAILGHHRTVLLAQRVPVLQPPARRAMGSEFLVCSSATYLLFLPTEGANNGVLAARSVPCHLGLAVPR